MADPFDDGLLVERVSGRMTPRLEFVCRLHGCYPLDSNFDAWADDDKMGIMDAPVLMVLRLSRKRVHTHRLSKRTQVRRL